MSSPFVYEDPLEPPEVLAGRAAEHPQRAMLLAHHLYENT
jgi:hypothetical protein